MYCFCEPGSKGKYNTPGACPHRGIAMPGKSLTLYGCGHEFSAQNEWKKFLLAKIFPLKNPATGLHPTRKLLELRDCVIVVPTWTRSIHSGPCMPHKFTPCISTVISRKGPWSESKMMIWGETNPLNQIDLDPLRYSFESSKTRGSADPVVVVKITYERHSGRWCVLGDIEPQPSPV